LHTLARDGGDLIGPRTSSFVVSSDDSREADSGPP
jgi:hypothetical protein